MENQTRQLRIAVVDDEPFTLKIFMRLLDRLGQKQVSAFTSGEAGLKQCTAAAAPEVVFLDINMPGLDGVEFVRRLAEARFGGAIVLVSGENSRTLESVNRLVAIHRLKSLGCLQKPVQLADVSQLLEQLIATTGRAPARHTARQPFGLEQLRTAIDSEQVVCHYQPKIDLRTDSVVGAECLVRLQDRDGHLIFPDQFIVMAEEHALIQRITWQVLATAMEQAKCWRRAGTAMNVAVNVSMNDLMALDFPDSAAGLAESIGIEPECITLEVTESQVMTRMSTVLEVLTRLRLKRFRLSIDDFGTGHSSLAQLRDLPFDELKIDRGFVLGVAGNPTLQALCSASLRMAQQLNMGVVAEGVETTADRKLLEDLGCESAQGYLIAKPMPAAQLDRWRSGWQGRVGRSLPLSG